MSGLPKRTIAYFTFNPLALNGQAATTLSISTSRRTYPGTYFLTIAASNGTYRHTVPVALTVS